MIFKRSGALFQPERISLQQRPRLPNLLLTGLLCRHAFVVRQAVDGHLASVGASEHAYERCGYVAVGVNEPAAVAAFPDTQAVNAEPSDVLGCRRREAKSPEGCLGVPKRRPSKRRTMLRLEAQKTRDRVDAQSCHQLDRSPSPLVVQPAVGPNPPVLLHFPADVIEDVLPGERSAVECLRDLRPDLVPRAPDLLSQIPAERSEQVRKLFRVPAVLWKAPNRSSRRNVRGIRSDRGTTT